ncbi:MAG: hypothetical protein IIW27_04215 [Clostridia bacterium]|jgi:hypothetical protein|nr:hypothetical protein [Clostridia bacterium]
MKKRLCALALFLCAAFVLSGCSATVSSVALGSSWNKDIPAVYTYTITQQPSAFESVSGYDFTLISGTYTTKLTPKRVGDLSYLEYETETVITGKYTVRATGEEIAVNDVTTSKTLLHEINTYSLFPVSSEKTILQTGVAQTIDGYELNRYDMKYAISYDYEGKKATTTLYQKNAETGAYDKPLENSTPSRTYKKLKAGAFFDNDALLFIIRAFSIKKGSGAQFSTIDVINGKKAPMAFAVDSVDPYVHELTVNGEKTQFTVLPAQMAITTTMSGAAYELLIGLEVGKNKNVPLTIASEMPYGLGKLVYTLTAFSD